MTELEAIRRYWNTRAEGYSLKTAYDLQHAEKVWLERLRPFVLASGKLDILDIGCGPGFFSILLARGFGLVATPVYPVLRRAMLLYRPAQQELSSPAELFVSFTQEYARRHCLDSLPDDSLTALANTAG